MYASHDEQSTCQQRTHSGGAILRKVGVLETLGHARAGFSSLLFIEFQCAPERGLGIEERNEPEASDEKLLLGFHASQSKPLGVECGLSYAR